MIPAIAYMMGFYIITRMISFITRSGDRAEVMAVEIAAVITIVITLAMLAIIVVGEFSTTSEINQLGNFN